MAGGRVWRNGGVHGKGAFVARGACMAEGDMCGKGACVAVGHAWGRAIAAGGKHPPGMHSYN